MPISTQTYARIRRLGDTIAIDFDDTETLYLSVELALAVARKLEDGVDDIRQNKFTDSNYGTHKL